MAPLAAPIRPARNCEKPEMTAKWPARKREKPEMTAVMTVAGRMLGR